MTINPKTLVKYITIFLASLFVGIVLLEQVPGVMTPTGVPYEQYMFNLFVISLVDDITHGISGILGFVALFYGYKWSVRYLMLIGGYYSLDALFSTVNGVFTGQSIIENFLLNVPHYGITFLVMLALYYSLNEIKLN